MPRHFWNTHLAVLLAALATFLATLIFYAPTVWTFECIVLLTDGVLALLWISSAAACGLAALRFLKITPPPLLLIATAGALGLGIFSLIFLGLGLAGLLNRPTALAMPFLSFVLFAINYRQQISRHQFSSVKQWLLQPAGFSWLWLIPVISLATAALAASIMPGDLWRPWDPDPYDVLSYHLQVPREWFEAGKILPLQHNVFSYFPFNVEMQFLAIMHAFGGPWKAMYICQLLNVGYAGLMILAIAGATNDAEKNSRFASTLAAAMVSAVPWVLMLASVAYVESALMLYTALAIIWLMRVNSARHTVLVAIFTGLAAGVKITAIPMLIPAIAVILIWKRSLASATIFLIISLSLVSPWLIRNTIWTGNPLFPVAMSTLGHAHFTPEQVQRFRIAHSPTPTDRPLIHRITILWTDVLAHPQFGYLLLPLAILAMAWHWRNPTATILLLVGINIFIVWFFFTHLQPRFLVMIIPVAALAIAQIPWRRARPAGFALCILSALLGYLCIFPRLSQTTRDPIRCQLIGKEDLSFTIPPELADMTNSDKQIALIGDAGAFLYQIPMTRLHYRTVFDLPANVTDPIQAWAGPDAKQNPNYLFVINPSEIARLHQTYLYISPLPQAWASQGYQPFVFKGGDKNPNDETRNPNQ